MLFEDLIQIDGVGDPKERARVAMKRATNKRPKLADMPRGCDYCPAKRHWKHGVKPVKGKVRGKKIFIWGMSPGKNENTQGKELVGDAGKLLWQTLEQVGIEREDCDIQNIVRCWPVDVMGDGDYLKMRDPSKEEQHCCSIYNDRALEKSRARVFVVLGLLAQKQLLGQELKKNRKIYYSERFKVWVVCVDHPSYYVRQGGLEGGVQHTARFKDWVKMWREVQRLAKVKGGSRFAFLEQQDYKYVVTAKEARRAYKEITSTCRKHNRLSVDFEEGHTSEGKIDDDGGRTALVLGFSPKPGMSRVFWLDHPDLPRPRTRRDRRVVWKLARRLLESGIPKTFHKGNYDVDAVEELMGAHVQNYDYDSEYGEYFAYPDAKAYGLMAIANRRFPQFAGYKEILVPDALTSEFKKKLPLKVQQEIKDGTADWSTLYDKSRKTSGGMNLARLPWKKILLYNGADCDIQKRIELTTSHKSNPALMHVYRDAGFVLARMERQDAPKFDYKHYDTLMTYYPKKLASDMHELRLQVKKILRTKKPAKVVMTKPTKKEWHSLTKKSWKTFNPSSSPQVLDLLYNWMRLPVLETRKNKDRKTGKVKPTTDKEVMVTLADHSPVPVLIQGIRRLRKILSTSLDGYKKCADANKGRLRTKFWLTGTGTGRISSGGGANKKASDEAIVDVVNLQNIDGDTQLQCLIISDAKWWKLQRWFNEHGPIKSDADIPDWVWDIDVFLGFDHAQMELRVLAQKSGDKALIKIFSTEQELVEVKPGKWKCKTCGEKPDDCACGDPHSMVGHELTGWAVKEIKNNERTRRIVKNMQFGIVFGLNENNLFDYMVAKGVYKYSDGTPEGDRQEERDREEVRKFHRKYFKRFGGVKRMIDKDRAFAEEYGFAKTMTGLRRPLDIHGDSEDEVGHGFWGNQAVNCVDYKTEALTQRGWLKGFELQRGDIVLTFNPSTRMLEWQSATNVHVFPDFEGWLYDFKGKSFSALTTPDHRWPVTSGSHDKQVRCKLSKELPKWSSFIRTGGYDGPAHSKYSDDWIRLIGWVLTDGFYSKGQGYASNSVAVCQVKPCNVKRIDRLFARLGIPFRTKDPKNRKKSEEIFWYLSGESGARIRSMFPERILVPEFLLQLPKRQLRILYKTMVRGDGSVAKNGTTFTAKSRKAIDMFQMLCMLCGKAASVKYRDLTSYRPKSCKLKNVPNCIGCWSAQVLRRKRISIGWVKRSKIWAKTGMWCPEVPNTYFVARRNGQPYVTGNTGIQGTASHLMLMGLVPIKRKPKRYKLLKHPQMEIHDALYPKVKLRNLWKACARGQEMLETEPIKIMRREFKIDWKVKLKAEGKAGFRFGQTMIKLEKIHGENKTAQFLNMWCAKNRLVMGALRCMMKGTHKFGENKQCRRCGKSAA